MEDQKGKEATGGTMRLGSYEEVIVKGTLAEKIYGKKSVAERHRHRYECNNAYRDQYESWGMRVAGHSPDGNLVEMIDVPGHRFFFGAQSHPEFNSRPNKPWPFFGEFVKSLIVASK